MPAYFVYVCQEVLDRAKLEAYWREIVATLEGYGARSLSSYAPFERLEGVADRLVAVAVPGPATFVQRRVDLAAGKGPGGRQTSPSSARRRRRCAATLVSAERVRKLVYVT
jgi:hypothetical protein